jgi:hypothetical protein
MESCVREAAQPSHLFRSPGLLIDHLTVDAMHAGDLGTFQDAVGSLFWIEISHKQWFRNQNVGLKALNVKLKSFYDAHENFSRVYPLALTQVIANKPGYPYLKAKAAQTRHLAKFCLALAQLHKSGDGGGRGAFRFQNTHRLAADSQTHIDLLVNLFQGLHDYTESCMASPFSVDECRRAMYVYLQSLEALHKLWRRGLPLEHHGPQPWHLRPKAHVCQHMVHEKVEAFGSPNMFWGYRDEDFVGVVKAIASKTKHPATLEERMIQKLRILAAFD